VTSIISPVIWEVIGDQLWVSKQNFLSLFIICPVIGKVIGGQIQSKIFYQFSIFLFLLERSLGTSYIIQCNIFCHFPILWKWSVTYHHKDINNITNMTLNVWGVKMMSEFVCVYSRITYVDSWPWRLLKIKFGTVVLLEFEKHLGPFIYSLGMKTIPIHIFTVQYIVTIPIQILFSYLWPMAIHILD